MKIVHRERVLFCPTYFRASAVLCYRAIKTCRSHADNCKPVSLSCLNRKWGIGSSLLKGVVGNDNKHGQYHMVEKDERIAFSVGAWYLFIKERIERVKWDYRQGVTFWTSDSTRCWTHTSNRLGMCFLQISSGSYLHFGENEYKSLCVTKNKKNKQTNEENLFDW